MAPFEGSLGCGCVLVSDLFMLARPLTLDQWPNALVDGKDEVVDGHIVGFVLFNDLVNARSHHLFNV